MIPTERSRAAGAACLLAASAAMLVLGGCAQTRASGSAAKSYSVGSVGTALSVAAARDPEELARLQRRIQRGTYVGAARARPVAAGAVNPRRAVADVRPAAFASTSTAAVADVPSAATPAALPARAGLETATLQRVDYARSSRPSAAPATGPVQALDAWVAAGRTRPGWLIGAGVLAVLVLLAGLVSLIRRRRSGLTEAGVARQASVLLPANDAGVAPSPRRTRSDPPPPLVTIRASR